MNFLTCENTIALLWSLKKRYDNGLDLFLGKPLHEWDIPKEILEVSQFIEKSPKSRKRLEEIKDLEFVSSAFTQYH